MFKYNYRIGFSDCDPAGVIFTANAFIIAHKAFEDFFISRDLFKEFFLNENFAYPVKNSEVDFYTPLFAGDEVVVEMGVSDLRDSSFEIISRLSKTDGTQAVKIRTVHVCIEKKKGAKHSIDDQLRKLLGENLTGGT